MVDKDEAIPVERDEWNRDPTVSDVLAMEQQLARILGPTPPCPMCRGTEWASFPYDLGLAFTNPATQDGIATSVHVIVLICHSCRFIRLHNMPSEHDV